MILVFGAGAGEAKQGACSATKGCDAAYKACLRDCDLVYGPDSGKCRYLCCDDRRTCETSHGCRATECAK
jgi:hypothetical protein